MRSVADDLRKEQAQEILKMSPEQRMELALTLGRRALEMYMAATGKERTTALADLRRGTTSGRVPSRSHDEP